MKFLAFAATNNSQSINKKLVTYVTSLIPEATVDLIDLNDFELPLFSQDREAVMGQPALAKQFIDKIAQSDALVISFAEHNGSYSVAYKNIFDWASRINPKVFQSKPMLMLATSPGKAGAASVLAAAKTSAPYFAGDVKAAVSVPSFYENFDVALGKITDQTINEQLLAAVKALY